MNKTLRTIVALVLATTLPAFAQRPQGRPGGPEQNRLPEGSRIERDLVYGSAGGSDLKLNLYLPPGDEARPLIIWIHGGAWLQGSKDGPSPAQQFVGSGYAVAHVGYRLSQVAKWPAQMHDCKAAVRWLRANAAQYHLDPKRFAAWGSSAGGHLVAVLGTSGGVAELEGTCNDLKTSSSVQAVVDWFGPTDFLQMNKFRSNIAHDEAKSPESQLIGGPIQENKEATAKANPITYVGRVEAPPPFLIMHGTKDDLVPFNQSELLNDALKAAKADVTFLPMEGAGHGFGGEQSSAPVREFLTRVLGKTVSVKGAETPRTDGKVQLDNRAQDTPPQPQKRPNPDSNVQGGPRGRALPEGVKVVRDLSYAADNDPKHRLDLYLPEKSDKLLPLLICIHGGGWAMGDKAGGSPLIPLANEGYAVAVISYRLSQQAKFPAQIQDCKAAVRWLRANSAKYNIDPNHFGTWGGSAGGHLSALTGTSGGSKEFEPIGGNDSVSDRVQAVCDLFGPTDLLKMNEQSGGRGGIKHDEARSPESRLIGGPIQENKEKAERANPLRYITKDCPPFLIMHGLGDDLVPIGQSEILLDALKKQGIEATFIKLRAGHGTPEFRQPENIKIIKEFFDKHLKK